MKIEIEIDVEGAIAEAIKQALAGNTMAGQVYKAEVTGPIAATEPAATEAKSTKIPAYDENATDVEYEYAPKPGRRRSKLEMALHDKEVALGRTLTAEEKGEIDAQMDINSAKQETAKRLAKANVVAKEVVAEVTAEESTEDPNGPPESTEAVTQQDEDEAKGSGLFDTDEGGAKEETKQEEGSDIPKTDDLSSVQSLFS